MAITLRRTKDKDGLNHRVWPIALLAGLLSLGSYVSANTGFDFFPGISGHSLSIRLDDPIPYDGKLYAVGFEANSAAIDAPIPLPEPIDASLYSDPVPMPQDMAGGNFTLPSAFDTGPAAAPFVQQGRSPTDNLRAAICLSSAIYYEAANESDDGQRAVAQVILNRLRHPSWPNTVCGVIYQGSEAPGCQFSYACDGSMARLPSRDAWARASRNARAALAGYVHAPVGLSTYYHTPQVNPVWNRKLTVASVIGNHIFYRMPGGIGAPQAFGDRYAGSEPTPGPHPRRYTPAPIGVPMLAANQVATLAPWPGTAGRTSAALAPRPAPTRVREDNRYVSGTLPESDVMPEYRNSGQWIGR